MNLILIHGALGTAEELKPLVPYLENHYAVHLYELPGHGERAGESEKFKLNELEKDFRSFIQKMGDCVVFGFSLGGYLALQAAMHGEKRIKGIVTLGTKVKWSPEEAEKEVRNLDVQFLEEKAAPFYTYLSELHGDHLVELCRHTAAFMRELGDQPTLTTETVTDISIPVRMGRGGKDRMVDAESTCTLVEAIPHAEYIEIPSFPHPLGFLKPVHVARFVVTQLQAMSYQSVHTHQGKLAYHWLGEPFSNEPVAVFLHEALGSIAQWGDFPGKLCQALQLPGLVYERLGYGDSDANPKSRTHRYLHEAALVELPEFLEQLDVRQPLILVGHSDGGSIALLYAAAFPERIHTVITMAAHVYNETITVEGIQAARKAWEEGKLKGLEIYHGAKTEKLFFDWNDTWQTPEFLKWDISKDIVPPQPFPALIIQGEDDQYGSPQQVVDIVRILGDEAEGLLVPQAGHSPFLDQPESLIEEIAVFVSESKPH
jgi:pimeloyl-ACP methyl ester carboxylesterase